MRVPWFTLRGIIFLPSSAAGWLVAFGAVAYCVYAFLEIDARSHSVSDTLINVVFRYLLVMLAYSVTAWATSRPVRR
jgi:hypothetical protein